MKRFLTEEEIENILNFIKPQRGVPIDFSNSLMEKQKSSLRNQLKKYKVYPQVIPHLKENISKQYFSSLIQPGENVGIQAGQNIGREQTQIALDAFHRAGARENFLVEGTSRFNEFLCMTKDIKMPISKIYFTENNNSISSLREMIGSSLVEITFNKLVSSYFIYSSKEKVINNLPETEKWYKIFEKINEAIPDDLYCIVFNLDKSKLFEFKININKVIEKIKDSIPEIICVESPKNLAKLHIYFHVRREDLDDDDIYNYISDIYFNNISQIYLSGIKGIKEIFYLKSDENTKEGEEWIIESGGTNLTELLSHPKIDSTRTVSNNVWDIYNLLGIEAAREFLIDGFTKMLSEINMCDIQILVDTMTYSGILSSISRHAMKRDQVGSLSKACFEEVIDNFCKSGLYGEHDNLRGVSASIICGKIAKIGSGVVDLIYDTKCLNKVE